MQTFNKFHLLKISESFTIILWNINNLKSVKKSEKIFFNIFFLSRIQFALHTCRSQPFLAIQLLLKYVFKNKARKQKRQMVPNNYQSQINFSI